MFTRKTKRNYRIAVWSVVVVCLCILIVYFAWPQDPHENVLPGTNPDYDPSVAANSVDNSKITDIVDNYYGDDSPEDNEEDFSDEDENENETSEDIEKETAGNLSENEEAGISQPGNPYYLVKRVNTDIVVFFCDANGNMVQLETTEILYEMLGPDDQVLFDQGIRIGSQEELSVLLQDFEG